MYNFSLITICFKFLDKWYFKVEAKTLNFKILFLIECEVGMGLDRDNGLSCNIETKGGGVEEQMLLSPFFLHQFTSLPSIMLKPRSTEPIQEVFALDSPKYSKRVNNMTPNENIVPSRIKLMTKLPRQTSHPQPPSGASFSVVCSAEFVLSVSEEFWEFFWFFSISINFRISFMRCKSFSP